MSNQDSGDKTEQPTEKRLQDARKKGDVAKSKDLTSTVTLLVWLCLGASMLGWVVQRLAHLSLQVLAHLDQPFEGALSNLGVLALQAFVGISAVGLIPVMLVGTLVEFLQIGPVFSMDKLKPKLEHLNPVAGIKKMFSLSQLIEVIKSIIKTTVLVGIGFGVLRSLWSQIMGLANAQTDALGLLLWQLVAQLLGWTLGVFAFVSLLDTLWQRYSFTKKMRMSRHDIKKEMKENEGDPLLKSQRKQTQHEWAQQNAANAAASANVLVVNPTHVAIAIDYHRQDCPVPTLAAKGEDDTARAMREAAMQAGVPIVRNVALARDMLARVEVGEIVPQDLFEIMAEVILWAAQVREILQAQTSTKNNTQKRSAPGEDKTRYEI
jgi:type III secretion protein U